MTAEESGIRGRPRVTERGTATTNNTVSVAARSLIAGRATHKVVTTFIFPEEADASDREERENPKRGGVRRALDKKLAVRDELAPVDDRRTESVVRPPPVVVLENIDASPQLDEDPLAGLADLVGMIDPRQPAPLRLDGRRSFKFDEVPREPEKRVVVLIASAGLGPVNVPDRVGEVRQH